MLFSSKNKSGNILIEILIAITVFSLGLTATTALLSTNTKSITNSGHRLVAISLAREGLEAMRQIRDTNILLCPSDSSTLWRDWERGYIGTCNISSPSAVGENTNGYYFALDFDNTNKIWKLLGQQATKTLAETTICLDKSTATYSTENPCSTGSGIDSRYRRTIYLEYCTEDLVTCDNTVTRPVAHVKSIVSWRDAGSKIDSQVNIDTYLHRDVHSSI